MVSIISDKRVLLASVVSFVYFMLLFAGIPARLNFVMVGVIAEIITIPLMVLQVLILVHVGRRMNVKEARQVWPLVAAAAISLLLIVLFFLVK